MPPVVSVFEGDDVELECKARYANGTLIQPCCDSVLQWFVVLENTEVVFVAGCGRVVSFKYKTVEFNQDNGNLTILDIGLADDAVVKCTVLGLFASYSNMTHLKVKKGKCLPQKEWNLQVEFITFSYYTNITKILSDRNYQHFLLLNKDTLIRNI